MLTDALKLVMVFNVFNEGCAAIAGGCLRDLETNRTPKDIDVIIHYEDKRDYAEAEIQARHLGYTIQYHGEGSGREGMAHEDDPIRNVLTFHKEGMLDIDVIFMDCSVVEAVNNFPCNAVMVWLEDGVIRSNDKYTQFMNTGKLEFYNTATDEYKARLQSYYTEG